jgi:hypothetical protein
VPGRSGSTTPCRSRSPTAPRRSTAGRDWPAPRRYGCPPRLPPNGHASLIPRSATKGSSGTTGTWEDLAAEFGGPEDTDWNGHGSWIGGNIAATIDGAGTNGIAPRVRLTALKISEWCGSAYDSTLLHAIVLAADKDIDVVNISFGGYQGHADRVVGRQRGDPDR